MKAVFVLGIVLVIAAVVVSAEENHKKKNERNHGGKNHKELGDRSHGKKDRSKKDHSGKKDRSAEKHEGKKDRSHNKNSENKERNHAVKQNRNKKTNRQTAETCGANQVACCDPKRCIATCKDGQSRRITCDIQNWWNSILDQVFGDDKITTTKPITQEKPEVERYRKTIGFAQQRAKEECTPENENYKCVCENGFVLNDADKSCVKECPEEKGNNEEDEDDGDDGADGDDGEDGNDGGDEEDRQRRRRSRGARRGQGGKDRK